jgi:hypothetical protein
MVEYTTVRIRTSNAHGDTLQHVTEPQYNKLVDKWRQADEGRTFTAFLESVQPTFGCDGAVAVRWCGMWLCIERDGYCHS